MKLTDNPCFSNGTEQMIWFERNCDRCWKASKYNEKKDDYTAFKCKINAEITGQICGFSEISLRTYNITKEADCPYRQETKIVKKHRKTENKPLSLF